MKNTETYVFDGSIIKELTANNNILTLESTFEQLKKEIYKKDLSINKLANAFYEFFDRSYRDVTKELIGRVDENKLLKAFSFIEQEAQKGDKETKFLGALLIYEDLDRVYKSLNNQPKRKKKYYSDAKLVFEEQANENPRAKCYLAQCYYYGLGAKEDKEQAVKLFKEASNSGSQMAKFFLGKFYALDKNSKQESLNLNIELAKNGYIKAYVKLSYFYKNNIYVDGCIDKAVELLQYAAKFGDPMAKYKLTILYESGIAKGEITTNEVHKLCMEAADIGCNKARNLLAQSYKEGSIIVKKDQEQAILWYEKAIGYHGASYSCAEFYLAHDQYKNNKEYISKSIGLYAYSLKGYGIYAKQALNNLFKTNQITTEDVKLILKPLLLSVGIRNILDFDQEHVKGLGKKIKMIYKNFQNFRQYIITGLSKYIFKVNEELIRKRVEKSQFDESIKSDNDFSEEFKEFYKLFNSMPKELKLCVMDYFIGAVKNNNHVNADEYKQNLNLKEGYYTKLILNRTSSTQVKTI